mgnify:CR=1 FL=1
MQVFEPLLVGREAFDAVGEGVQVAARAAESSLRIGFKCGLHQGLGV